MIFIQLGHVKLQNSISSPNNIEMGEFVGTLSWCEASHLGQLSVLPSVVWEISTVPAKGQ